MTWLIKHAEFEIAPTAKRSNLVLQDFILVTSICVPTSFYKTDFLTPEVMITKSVFTIMIELTFSQNSSLMHGTTSA